MIDEFIQKMQLKIGDTLFEWIPYYQLSEIKETDKNGSIIVYSAIWKNGPIYKKNKWSENYTRDSNKEVILKRLHNLKDSIESVINEVQHFYITF
jgi:hypothetical protein